MDMQAKKIARNYAKAFLNYTDEAFSASHCQLLVKAVQELDNDGDCSALLKIPIIPNKIKRQELLHWYTLLALPGPIEKLLDVLIQHQRLFLFPLIMQELCNEYYERNNIVACSIRATVALSKEQVDIIHRFLEHKTGKTIQARVIEDKELIAGIRMQSNFFLWEYSLRQRLRALAKLV